MQPTEIQTARFKCTREECFNSFSLPKTPTKQDRATAAVQYAQGVFIAGLLSVVAGLVLVIILIGWLLVIAGIGLLMSLPVVAFWGYYFGSNTKRRCPACNKFSSKRSS